MVTVEMTYSSFVILINGLPHLLLNRLDLLGIQSWIVNDHMYCIEYTMKGGKPILCEYDRREVWQKILEEFGSMKIF